MGRHNVSTGIAVATLIVMLSWLLPQADVTAEMAKPRNGSFKQNGPQGRFLGLRQAIEIALEKHPVIQAADANLKASEARTEQTRALY